jgi:aspartyl-tRNA(Asn)/glutamyl-tRNA(Gln) amidotransferase subunit C
MSLGLDDVYRIAELAHIGINEEAAQRMQAELNDIFKMIERIQAVDTEGVEPIRTTVCNVCAKTRWSSATTAKKT